MKLIKIKKLFQKNKSLDCGPISTRMILNYFGISKSEDGLKKEFRYSKDGTYIYDNGVVLLRAGLLASLITANPLIFKKEDQKRFTKNALVKHLDKLKKRLKKKVKALSLFKEFVAEGGEVVVEIPEIKHVSSALNQGKLVLALLYGGALGTNEGDFHFVVVSGYKKGFVYINNPLKKAKSGWFKERDFLYSLHSSTCADIDNGSLLIVGNK